MSLFHQILEVYPELQADEYLLNKVIVLRDDSDGQGAYIEKWEYSKPVPNGMKVGK